MSIIRGDSTYWTITLTKPDETPFPLNGCDVWVTMKRNKHEPDSAATFQHTMTIDATGTVTASNGLSLDTTAATGVIIQRLSPEESIDIRPSTYYWDVRVRDPNGDNWTPILNETDTVIDTVTDAIVMV